MPRLAYHPALDGVRAFAVLGVIATHAGFSHLRAGGFGVYVFFVLSGYLITHLLATEREATGRLSLRRFYARRALRLLPALALLLIASAVWALADGGPTAERTLRGIPFVALYVGNWANAASPIGGDYDLGLLGHTWSLSVEEQFYLLWPLALIAIAARGGRVAAVAVGLAVLSALSRIVFWGGTELPQRLHGTDQAADAILVGCALAALLHGRRDNEPMRRAARWLVWPSMVLLAVAAARVNALTPDLTKLRLVDWVLLPAIALASAVVIAHLVLDRDGALARAFGWRPLAWLGKISYGIYLWHLLVIRVVAPHVGGGETVRLLVLVTVTVAVAATSFYLVERPFLLRKRRWEVVPTRA